MQVSRRDKVQKAVHQQLTRFQAALERLAQRLRGAGRRAVARASTWRTREEILLRRARRELWKAKGRHCLGVLRSRVELQRAARTYRRECERAEKSVRKAENEAAAAVTRADEHLRDVARPREIASYGPFALLDDSLRSPSWEVSLASVHAVILPADSAALKGVGSAALPHLDPQEHPRRNRLAVQSREGENIHDFSRGDRNARDFARLVNIAALNAGRLDQKRREDMNVAAEHLEEARAWAATRLVTARELLDATVADTAALDVARDRLGRARVDTGEIEACRAAVAELEELIRAAQLEIPPDPEDVPTE